MKVGDTALILGIAGVLISLFGVPDEKFPRVARLRTARSIPGWFLILYPGLGEWFLRMSGQDFVVSASGSSPLTAAFNWLTTDIGHFWLALAGFFYLGVLMALAERPEAKMRRADVVLALPSRDAAQSKFVYKPRPPSLPPLSPVRPLWVRAYYRKGDPFPWISESPPERRWGTDPEPTPISALVARFSTLRYVSDVKARLTYFDTTGKEFASRRGLWLETDHYNEVAARVGDVPALVIFLYADDGGRAEYAIADDKRQRYTQTYAAMEFVPCPVTTGWTVRVSLFHDGKSGSEHTFECFADGEGMVQIRNLQTKESSE